MINTFSAIKYKSPRNNYILPEIKLQHNIAIRLSRATFVISKMCRRTAVHSARQGRGGEGGDITFVGLDLNTNTVLYGD